MTETVSHFLSRLVESGLWTPQDVEQEEAVCTAETRPESLADKLVAAGKLTRFQADRLLSANCGPLVLGNYVLLDEIGAGGMGQVFKAEHRRMKCIVALKVLPAAVTSDPDSIHRFQREVEAVARLSHPNIVAAHDADEAQGVHFLVMEYVEGDDLAHLVRRAGPQPLGVAVQLVIQAARGLGYAHSRGIVHRDIKPSNLLLDRRGNIKILDLGLARIDGMGADTAGALTSTGMMMGTVDYMSPEQAFDSRQAGPESDIYSLGCTLFFLAAGRPPFGGETVMQKLMAHREAAAPRRCNVIRSRMGDSRDDEVINQAEALDGVLQRMLAKRPQDRFGRMSDVIAALEATPAATMATVIRVDSFEARQTACQQGEPTRRVNRDDTPCLPQCRSPDDLGHRISM